MLTEAQFEILKTVYLCPEQTLTQRALAAADGHVARQWSTRPCRR